MRNHSKSGPSKPNTISPWVRCDLNPVSFLTLLWFQYEQAVANSSCLAIENITANDLIAMDKTCTYRSLYAVHHGTPYRGVRTLIKSHMPEMTWVRNALLTT